MRKLFTVILAMCFLMAVGLAEESNVFQGTWVASKMIQNGQSIPVEQADVDLELEVNGLSVAITSVAMRADHDVATFQLKNDGLEMMSSGNITYRIEYQGDGILKLIMKDKVGNEIDFLLDKVVNEPIYEQAIESENIEGLTVTGNEGLIVSDFALVPGRFHHQMVLILTNVSDKIIPEAEIQVIFYNANGGVIATEKDGHDAILPGSSVVTQKTIYDKGVEEYATVEVMIDTDKYDNSYVNHASKLDITENSSNDKVFLQITNNDTVQIAEIEIVVVFYKDGHIIGASEEETFDLGVGKKTVLEFYGVDSADEYKIFINQAHTWW